MRMRAGNRKRFCTTLLVGAAALSLGCEVAKEASWKLRATVEASPQTSANATYSCCRSVGRDQVPQTKGSPSRGYSRGGSGGQSTDSRENPTRRKAILQRPLIGGWNRSLQHVP